MNPSNMKAEYDTQGFVVIRGFLQGPALVKLQTDVERYIHDVVPHLPDTDAFYEDRARPDTLKQLNRMQQASDFAAVMTDPHWLTTAEQLLGEAATAQGVEWFNKPPGTNHPTPPHQDNFYFCFTPPLVLTMWLALDDVNDENGCLRYIPGSHVRGIRPHRRTQTLGFSQGIADYGAEDYAAEIPIHCQPGDVLIHHGNTIHRAEANRSTTRHRRSFALVFQGISCQRDDVAYQRYLQSASSQHREMGVLT